MNLGVTGTGTGIASNIPAAPAVPLDSSEKEFWNKVEHFRGKADEAYSLWQTLRAKRQAAATNPELLAEWNKSIGEAEDLQAKISDVERVAAQAKEGILSTVKGWVGLEGIQTVQRNLGQVGIIQYVAYIAISAAITWISSWIADAYVVDRKLTAVENLTAQGMSPQDAGDLIADKGAPGTLDIFAGNLGTGIAAVAGVGLLLYFFFEKKRGF